MSSVSLLVWFYVEFINHRDTEDTKVAQRRALLKFLKERDPYGNPNLVGVRVKQGAAMARTKRGFYAK